LTYFPEKGYTALEQTFVPIMEEFTMSCYRSCAVFALFIALTCTPALGQTPYKLVWSDEFNGEELDASKWEAQVMPARNSGNEELGHYTARKKNVRVEKGILHIEAYKEDYDGLPFTSARIHGKGGSQVKYGKIEARLQLPQTIGFWPAYWMMPVDEVYGGWAASGEIDIMEATNVADHTFGTLHFGDKWPLNRSAGNSFTPPEGAAYFEGFHTYTIEWQPYEMRWYVDGKLFSTLNDWDSVEGPYPAPFDQRFYPIFNLAVGGRLAGHAPQESTVWPQQLLVDWIRIYQCENQPPQLKLLSPKNKAELKGNQPVLLEATASDPDDDPVKVQFYANDEMVGEVSKAPYRLEWEGENGNYLIRAKAVDSKGFVHWQAAEIIQGAGSPQKPYHGKPFQVPGRIEAEDFDAGVAGAGYKDNDRLNNGSAYRKNVQVDIQYCSEGGHNIGWMETGEWLEYTVTVSKTQNYDIRVRIGSLDGSGRFHVDFNGENKTATLAAPNTGDWQNYTDVVVKDVLLQAGEQVMRFAVDAGGMNLNYLEID
jgi:beta-glucanase (GH16 family)